MRNMWITLFCLSVGSITPATGQTIAERNPQYRLQYSDTVTITYRYTPEFNQNVVIGPDGRAIIAGLGSMVAQGLTLPDFTKQLTTLSEARLVKPDVSVTLKDYVKPHVYVEGEVNTPGRVELRENLSAMDAISIAGGFKQSGAKSNVLLLRRDAAENTQTRIINLTQFIREHKLEEVPQLRTGDVLYVSSTKLSKVQQITHLGDFGAIYSPVR
jgi:polysaccharide export outer membrane protein